MAFVPLRPRSREHGAAAAERSCSATTQPADPYISPTTRPTVEAPGSMKTRAPHVPAGSSSRISALLHLPIPFGTREAELFALHNPTPARSGTSPSRHVLYPPF